MKKSNKKILIPILAGVAVVIIAVCVVFAVTAKNNDDNKTATEPNTTAVTEAQTEAQTEELTEATQAYDEGSNEESNENNNEQTTSDDNFVIPTVTGIWKNENNLEGCTLEVVNQNGNTIDITITSMRGEASQIATCDATITLEATEYGSETRGDATFDYTDSFGNTGTCSISVAENVILLVVTEEYNDGRGWGISNATGDYILYSE